MKLTNDDVQEILRLLDDSDYDELHLQTDEFSITLRRSDNGKGWNQTTLTTRQPVVTHLDESNTGGNQQAHASDPEPAGSDDLYDIRAPMVGTFYKSPKPGAAPFVVPGDRVEEHSMVAIIEVMKLMNSVEAGVSGEIVEVLVDDAAFVEKGQVIMRARPGTE